MALLVVFRCLASLASVAFACCLPPEGLSSRSLPPFWGTMLLHCRFLICFNSFLWGTNLLFSSNVQCVFLPVKCSIRCFGFSIAAPTLDLAHLACLLSPLRSLWCVFLVATFRGFASPSSDCSSSLSFCQFVPQHRPHYSEKKPVRHSVTVFQIRVIL